jgi:predicted nucleic acid-binding protein
MRPVVYDAGVLIAADRGERRVWAEHRVRLEAGVVPLVPSPVLAQASRSPRQVQMRRLLRGCQVVPFDEGDAHAAGALLGKTRTRDVADASVVVLAVRSRADVVTDDVGDIERLLTATAARVAVIAP